MRRLIIIWKWFLRGSDFKLKMIKKIKSLVKISDDVRIHIWRKRVRYTQKTGNNGQRSFQMKWDFEFLFICEVYVGAACFLQMPLKEGQDGWNKEQLWSLTVRWEVAVIIFVKVFYKIFCSSRFAFISLQIYSMTLRLSALFEEKMKKISSDFKIGQKFNEKLRRSQRFKRRQSCNRVSQPNKSIRWIGYFRPCMQLQCQVVILL